MKNIRKFAVIFAVCLAFVMYSIPADAAKPKEPTVEFSATEVMESADIKVESKVFHAKDKERREMEMGGSSSVMILRKDKKVSWQLMPDQKMYMEHSLDANGPQNQTGASDMDYEMTEVGEETVNGFKCTKYKIIATAKDGSKFGGFMWSTKEGIMVKMDAISKNEKRKDRIKMELTDIKIGKQPASLFELPAGYSKMGFGSMMAAPPQQPSGSGKNKGQDKAPSSPDYKDLLKKKLPGF
ncbi:MAG: DUF4412 domain-containing protein [Deltaproteobacteria bacterium]|nr:DUF4412 domain-containing protein [Deltaproteobacteria bacterium]